MPRWRRSHVQGISRAWWRLPIFSRGNLGWDGCCGASTPGTASPPYETRKTEPLRTRGQESTMNPASEAVEHAGRLSTLGAAGGPDGRGTKPQLDGLGANGESRRDWPSRSPARRGDQHLLIGACGALGCLLRHVVHAISGDVYTAPATRRPRFVSSQGPHPPSRWETCTGTC